MKQRRLDVAMLWVCLGTAATAVSGVQATELASVVRPNIIMLLVDDLGWTDLGCYGSDLYRTPNIDRLASGAVRFTNAYAACTVCSPTRAALMTGMYPARLHLTNWINGSERPYARLSIPAWTKYLKRDYMTLPKALKAAGYLTIHAGKWHLAPRSLVDSAEEDRNYFPLRYGFDIQFAGTCSPGTYFYPYRARGFDLGLADGGKPGEYLTDRLTDEVLKVIERNRDRPLFVYFAHFNVHTPLEAKPQYVKKYQAMIQEGMRHHNPTYAAMVQSVDDSVGRILAKLEELKIADRTMIVFTSDNGGLDIGGDPTENRPLREGKGWGYEGGVRVPAIIKWPGVTSPGSVCVEPITTIDYYPTFLQAAKVAGDPQHNATVDGVSLLPILKNPAAKLEREAIYWHYPHYHNVGGMPYGAIRAGDMKLLEFYEDMRVELYNLREDLGETRNLADRMPDEAVRLRAMLHAWRKRVAAQMPTANPAYDAKKDAESGFLHTTPPKPAPLPKIEPPG